MMFVEIRNVRRPRPATEAADRDDFVRRRIVDRDRCHTAEIRRTWQRHVYRNARRHASVHSIASVFQNPITGRSR